ncbi:hypothetical protein Tco_0705537 [Tanacetum coccineum]|uniref:Uncharacterized protein n=1 Tax=Tanacetum coccineum TaxID=301880 RepID=A0ABQ4Y5S4_9ASTR
MTMYRMQLNSKFVNNMLPKWGRFVTAVKLNRGLRDSNYDQLYAYLKQHETHGAAGYEGAQNRVGNANPGQARQIKCYNRNVHNSEDTLEIAEITRKKMNDKMKDPECVKKKVKIVPHDYSKENYLATFKPHKQLTPEQIFWSKDLIKMKAEALKE